MGGWVVVGGRGGDVAHHMGGGGGGAVKSRGLASCWQCPPVGRGGEAGVIGGEMREVWMKGVGREGRGRRQVAGRGRGFIWQV